MPLVSYCPTCQHAPLNAPDHGAHLSIQAKIEDLSAQASAAAAQQFRMDPEPEQAESKAEAGE